jgi:hypothetical protein
MAYANLASATKLSRANQVITAIGDGGYLQLWTGSPPASPDVAATGTLLASLPLSSTPAVASYAVGDAVITAVGSGGTNGEYAVAFSGGNGTNAAATFTVAAGSLSQIVITNVGSGYTSVPTMGGFGAAGLTGASAIAVLTATLVFNAISTATAVATGNAGWARIVNQNSTGIVDLDVGVTNAASVVMSNTFIVQGGSVSCSAQVLIEA